MKYIFIYVQLFAILIPLVYSFLSIENGHFVYNNQSVFLSGVNAPWVDYARDFGSGAYNKSRAQFEKWFDRIAANGGNAVRVWLFIDAQWAPKLDANGYATGEDTQSLIDELGQYLDYAEKKNIFAILCLWNGAVTPTKALPLFSSDDKLDRFFEKVLKPLVSGLKAKKALGSWEVINEVVGSVQPNVSDAEPCFDTRRISNSGANWANTNLTMKQALRFINRHVDAIKSADPKVLVTSGAFKENPALDVCDYCYNYYKDKCLIAGGGKDKGVLDYYQIHTYPWQGEYAEFSVIKKTAADLKLDKPVIIGELPAKCESSRSEAQCYRWAYDNGYSGILGWRYDGDGDNEGGVSHSEVGMKGIANSTTHGVISVKIN